MSTTTTLINLSASPSQRGRAGLFWRVVWPPLLVGLLVLLGWQLLVIGLNVPGYILPAPTAIWQQLLEDFGIIFDASQTTALAVIGGILLGTLVAVLVSVLVSLFEHLSRPVLILVSIVSSAPIVALAPIFNAWFGATNLFSKISVAAIMVFFPVMVNTTTGLLSVSSLHMELMHSLGASKRQILSMVRVPGALPAFIDGLKIGAPLAVIGIIVAEYFGGPTRALGVMIANSAAVSQFALTWAAVFAASVLGITVFLVVLLLERLIVPWNSGLLR